MTIHADDIIRLLRIKGSMTTAQVAAHFSIEKVARVGSKLSKLADYGRISRDYQTYDENGQHRKCCMWDVRALTAAKHASEI